LRRGKFSKTEVSIALFFAALLFLAGFAGVALGIRNREWRVAVSGAGGVLLGLLYLVAAIRGRPL
jgi:hypothetical protein